MSIRQPTGKNVILREKYSNKNQKKVSNNAMAYPNSHGICVHDSNIYLFSSMPRVHAKIEVAHTFHFSYIFGMSYLLCVICHTLKLCKKTSFVQWQNKSETIENAEMRIVCGKINKNINFTKFNELKKNSNSIMYFLLLKMPTEETELRKLTAVCQANLLSVGG